MRLFDEKRFNEIYDRYAAAVVRYCLSQLSNDRAAAEEAASDTFLALHRKWDEVDLDKNVGAWLIKSADWCIKHQWAKYGRWYGRVEPLGEEHMGISSPGSPESEIIARETLERVERALPEKYAELFRLRNIEGLTMAEAARRLGENYVTTRFRYKKLDELLEELSDRIKRGKF